MIEAILSFIMVLLPIAVKLWQEHQAKESSPAGHDKEIDEAFTKGNTAVGSELHDQLDRLRHDRPDQ